MPLCVFDVIAPQKAAPPRKDDGQEHFRKTVRDWYRRCKNDFWYKNQMGFGSRKLEKAIGCTRQEIKNFSRTTGTHNRKEENPACQRVGKIMEHINARRLVFTPLRGEGAFWITPPDWDPRIDRLSLRKEWSIFARCSSCGDHRFLPVQIAGKDYAACYVCLPPSQHPVIGATLLRRVSLIRDALITLGYL